MTVDYDSWADIYDLWVDTAPVTGANKAFYVEEYRNTAGATVELGVGNGRILVEAALQGKSMIGVDSSTSMLALCRERAKAAGVDSLVHLIQADFREFELPEPAALIAIPFHTIGHLLGFEATRAGLERIHSQLRPGARLVFDHFVFDPEYVTSLNGVARLRADGRDLRGRRVLLWSSNTYDLAAQVITGLVWTDTVNDDGIMIERRYRDLSLGWMQPEQFRSLLEETGFQIEALYGGFDRRPFDDSSQEQVWVVVRPH